MKRLTYSFLCLLVIGCQQKEKPLTDPQIIVDKAIEAHGGPESANASFEFDFRERHYSLERKNNLIYYTRITQDSIGEIKDVLINSSKFKRYLNGREVIISDERRAAYSSSVNSVLYFAQLPFPLNDGAVNKEFLGLGEVEGNQYYKVKVTFDQHGGGEDYEDVFCYWINKETFTVDYIAYSYAETDGIGTRFRKAINRRSVEGFTFQDYINYKPIDESVLPPVHEHDDLFKSGQLEELSRIDNTNIKMIKILANS